MKEHKVKHNFRDFVNPLWACNLESETISYYLLGYQLFQKERRTLLNDIREIDKHIMTDHKNGLDQFCCVGISARDMTQTE